MLITDSAVSAGDWAAGRSRRSAAVAGALLALDQSCIIHDLRVVLRLVPGVSNGLADAISRNMLCAWLRAPSPAQATEHRLPVVWLAAHVRGASSS